MPSLGLSSPPAVAGVEPCALNSRWDPPGAQCSHRLLTHAVQEELSLGGEAVVDDVVQQWDVQAPGCQVSHDEGRALAVHELGQVDLAGRLVQGAVDVGAAHPLGRQQLPRVKTRGRERGEEETGRGEDRRLGCGSERHDMAVRPRALESGALNINPSSAG